MPPQLGCHPPWSLFGSKIMIESNTVSTYGRNFGFSMVFRVIDCIDTSYTSILVINIYVETLAMYHLIASINMMRIS